MKLLAVSLLIALFVQLHANKDEANGKLYLNSLLINDFMEPEYHDSVNITLTCSTGMLRSLILFSELVA